MGSSHVTSVSKAAILQTVVPCVMYETTLHYIVPKDHISKEFKLKTLDFSIFQQLVKTLKSVCCCEVTANIQKHYLATGRKRRMKLKRCKHGLRWLPETK